MSDINSSRQLVAPWRLPAVYRGNFRYLDRSTVQMRLTKGIGVAIRSVFDLKRLTEARRSILLYIAMAYAQSLALSLMIGLTGGYQSRWIGLGYLSMLIPAITVQIAKTVMREKQGSIGWRGFPLRYLPLALFLMPFIMHAAMLPVAAALGRLRWEDWLTTGTAKKKSRRLLPQESCPIDAAKRDWLGKESFTTRFCRLRRTALVNAWPARSYLHAQATPLPSRQEV
jgi:hypothetical protein